MGVTEQVDLVVSVRIFSISREHLGLVHEWIRIQSVKDGLVDVAHDGHSSEELTDVGLLTRNSSSLLYIQNVVGEIEGFESVLLSQEVNNGASCPHETISEQLVVRGIIFVHGRHANHELQSRPQSVELRCHINWEHLSRVCIVN